jgi:hypothetical protein
MVGRMRDALFGSSTWRGSGPSKGICWAMAIRTEPSLVTEAENSTT